MVLVFNDLNNIKFSFILNILSQIYHNKLKELALIRKGAKKKPLHY
jgi:hypothetical protein